MQAALLSRPVHRNRQSRLMHICGLLSGNLHRVTLFSLSEPGLDSAFATGAVLL